MRPLFLRLGYLLITIIVFNFSSSLYSQTPLSEIYDSEEFFSLGLQLSLEEKYDESISAFDKIYKTDLLYHQAQFEKANVLMKADRREELEALFLDLETTHQLKEYPPLYAAYGIYLSEEERFDESEEKFLEAEKYIANTDLFLFNISVLYIRKNETQKAADYLKKLIEHNPNNSSGHFLLGLIAYDDGRIVEGALGMLANLIIEPTGTYAISAISKLNSPMSALYSQDRKITISEVGDDFSELEFILRNDLALHDQYQLNVKIDEVYTRQVQAILDYMADHQGTEGFYERYYVPWLKDIAQKNHSDQFIYYSLVSMEENIGRPLTSQKRSIERFVQSYLANEFWPIFAKRNREHYGKMEDLVIYIQDGFPHTVGKQIKDQADGKFKVFGQYGNLENEFDYHQGEMNGLQTWYYPNGQKKEEAFFENGIKNGDFKLYYTNGALMESGTYVDDVLQGKFTTYYPTGGVDCETEFLDGLRNGDFTCYYQNGQMEQHLKFKNGIPDGPSFYYSAMGDLISEFNYVAGEYDGVGKVYFENQEIKEIATYVNGEVDGEYKDFYENRQLKTHITFQDKMPQKSIEYHPWGDVNMEKFFDRKGKLEKVIYYNEEGVKYFEEHYKNEKIEKITQYSGKTQDAVEMVIKNGRFTMKNLDGSVISEGSYDKSKMTGEWKFYDVFGNLRFAQNFENNQTNGLQNEFNTKGELASEYFNIDGNTSGLQRMFKHKKPSFKVFIKENIGSGPFQILRNNGTTRLDGFLIDDEKNYHSFIYFTDGTLRRHMKYINDLMTSYNEYNQQGELIDSFDFLNKNGVFDRKFNNGLVKVRTEYINGVKNGLEVESSINDEPIAESNYVNGKLHGLVKRYHPNGKRRVELNYINDKVHGEAKYYEPTGKLRLTTHYLFGNEYGLVKQFYPNSEVMLSYETLNDVRQGVFNYYNTTGKLIASVELKNNYPKRYRVLNQQGDLGDWIEMENGTANIHSKYSNGNTAIQLSFKNGFKEGNLTIKTKEGQPIYSVNYLGDRLDGERILYYDNGNVFKKEHYLYGDAHGLHEYFNENGNLEFSAEHEYDDLQGEVKIYENGQIQKTKIYDSDELVEIL